MWKRRSKEKPAENASNEPAHSTTSDLSDEVSELTDLPDMETGAPMPIVLADERDLLLAYVSTRDMPEWDGTNPRGVDETSGGSTIAIVRFRGCSIHTFGYPNDQVLSAHPLYKQGLSFYTFHEVLRPSWAQELARRNGLCYPGSEEYMFKNSRHFIATLHDSTFECLAADYRLERTVRGSVSDAIAGMTELLFAR